MAGSAIVLGAGMVGVATALELKRRSYDVTLVDRRGPGRETSYGNAGVLSRGSLMTANQPAVWPALPGLLRNRGAALRYDPGYVRRNLRWALGFLRHATPAKAEAAARALDPLCATSLERHRALLREAGIEHRLRETGWLKAYRSERAYAATALERSFYDRYGVGYEILEPDQIREREPHLSPIFKKGLLITANASVDRPGAVVEAYADLFVSRGGRIVTQEVRAAARTDRGWSITLQDGSALAADHAVVALGPWSKAFLERLGYDVPLAFERGYHCHYQPRGNALLHRPVHDVDGAYVMSSMEQGVRITTGIELNDIDAPPNPAQLALALGKAREAFPLGDALDAEPWMGRRPTFPDSLPMIGEAPRHPRLWLAFGHQHMGFTTGPGTAVALADLIDGTAPVFTCEPFRPSRYLR